MSQPNNATATKILTYAATAAGAAIAIPVPGVQVAAAIAQGLLTLGAQIAASESDPVPHVERVRDHWPVLRESLARIEQARAAARNHTNP